MDTKQNRKLLELHLKHQLEKIKLDKKVIQQAAGQTQ